MKLAAVSLMLFAIGLVKVDANIINDTEVTTTKDEHDTLTSSSEERRWTPIFPKIGQKFNLTRKPTTVRNNTTPIRPKNPVLNVVPKAVQMKSKTYWRTATTRRPLMKYTKFTVNPLTTSKIVANSVKGNEKKIGKNKEFVSNDNSMFRKIMDDDKESSEEDSDKSTMKRKNQNQIKHSKSWTSQFRKVQSKITKEMKTISRLKEKENKLYTFRDDTTDKIKSRISELSSEEEEDRNEYIFVTPKTTKDHAIVDADSDESGETTTIIEKKLKLRKTRSNNVIEEENLGTTISGFKFTGKVASLSNDLIFKNINI